MLQIRRLSAAYQTRPVLRDISLDVNNGEVLALIGPNGAGKSTIIRALSGVIPSSGEMRSDGDDLRALDATQRAQRIAVVPQAISLPPAFTVWETAAMGRAPYLGFLGNASSRDDELTRAALTRVNALTLSERRVGELSGGEAQRVLLARALCQAAPTLLLDEPTAHLDLHYQVSLLELIRELAQEENFAVLIALHDLNLAARYAHRVALLVNGTLTAVGSPRNVLTSETLSAAYGVDVVVAEHPFLNIPLALPK
ncbi:MAG: heme ABC transporter ATP-binding protein [Anaerolineales bacterium]|nr:heme ABC transporter ATP-binding protein [Anaerolineales bacterium]